MQVVDVDALNGYIKDRFETDPVLTDIWVRGEVSDYHRSAAGHCYFCLKSEQSQIRCVLFRGNAQLVPVHPGNGDSVIAHGRVSIYEVRGEYQLYVDMIQTDGIGLLYQQYEEIRDRLKAEGLFDAEHKRDLPPHPAVIGVVTSAGGSVWHDIQHVISRRYPLCELILAPAKVQGDGAAESIVEGLNRLQNDPRVDVIIVGRGGGSTEDLWCFNDEKLARAVFNSSVPVVSAVGHETDFSLCDFVADVRAPTPSAAAELVVPDTRDWREDLAYLLKRGEYGLWNTLQRKRTRLDHLAHRVERNNPIRRYQNDRLRLDQLGLQLQREMSRRVREERSRVRVVERQLDLVHPANILERGYALVLDTDTRKRIMSTTDASVGEAIEVMLHDGSLIATIDDVQQRGDQTNDE